MAKGTVSVVDQKGKSWTRIWCVYEMFVSVVEERKDYTYDMYTAFKHTYEDENLHIKEERLAVGITHNAVCIDGGDGQRKQSREEYFPLALMDSGISFRSQDGEASEPDDKVAILAEIGDKATVLNETIHAVAANAVLERVLHENDERRHQYLEALMKGNPLRVVWVNLVYHKSKGDTQENVNMLIDALAANPRASKIEELLLSSRNATELPRSLGRLTGLKRLTISSCYGLADLPDNMNEMVSLEEMWISGCRSLSSIQNVPPGVQIYNKPKHLMTTKRRAIAAASSEESDCCCSIL